MSARELKPLDDTAAERPSSSARDTLKELALFLPNFVILLKRLMTDPRVPRKSKLILGGTILYLVSPVDVVPDFVPGLGQLDDIRHEQQLIVDRAPRCDVPVIENSNIDATIGAVMDLVLASAERLGAVGSGLGR